MTQRAIFRSYPRYYELSLFPRRKTKKKQNISPRLDAHSRSPGSLGFQTGPAHYNVPPWVFVHRAGTVCISQMQLFREVPALGRSLRTEQFSAFLPK